MKKYLVSLMLTISFLSAKQIFAWGGRGHHTICEVAVHLVKNKDLKEFLQVRPHVMGHLCNIPDIYWKTLSGDIRKVGDSAHYIDSELLGLPILKIPTDYKKIIQDYTGKENAFKPGAKIFSVAQEVGSIWWRADQFMRRIADRKDSFAKVALPQNSKQESDEQFEYNQLVYNTIIDMGVMGHFVGDNSQPFHTTADHDGWHSGHGGIHLYYEEAIVAQIGGNLVGDILKKAQATENSLEEKNFLNQPTTIEKMRALSQISHLEMQTIYKKDPIIKKSEQKDVQGMKVRTVAERKSPASSIQIFQPMIVKEMSRSALLLAKLWDEAYQSIGSPNLKAYKNFKYPFTPDFIAPDYYDIASVAAAVEKK